MASHRRPRHNSQELVGKSSLDDLERGSKNAYVPLPEDNIALSVPLPDFIHENLDAEPLNASQSPAGLSHSAPSSSESMNHLPDTHADAASSERRNHLVKPEANSYTQKVQSLHKHLPHLRNLSSKGREKPVKIECYEYAERKLYSGRTFRFTESTGLLSEDEDSLGQYLANVPSDPVQLQLLIATDLSTTLMNCLGSSLDISPEMFEEHLLNSGWRDCRYDDSESDTWITRNMIKDYTSIKWYRPVKASVYGVDRGIDSAGDLQFTWTYSSPFKLDNAYRELKPSTNIFRRDWDLRTDAKGNYSARTHISTSWEERATMWTRQFKTCRRGTSYQGTSA